MGGQRTLRSYWKNYFEKTDTLIWVVDATDRLRIDDCREELAGLLLEEVGLPHFYVTCDLSMLNSSNCLASYGGQSFDLLEQNRCRGVHD